MALQVPELNPGGEVQAQLREEREQRRGKAALGRETGSTVPTPKLWVSRQTGCGAEPAPVQPALWAAGFLALVLAPNLQPTMLWCQSRAGCSLAFEPLFKQTLQALW